MIKRIAAFVAALGLTLVGLSVVPMSANAVAPCGVHIIEWGVNAPGADTNANRNAEFVRIVNKTGAELDVEGFWFQDNYPHVYKLQANKVGAPLAADSPFRKELGVAGTADDHFVLPIGGQVYLYNGVGVDGTPANNTAALYWGPTGFHHYNNAGDVISFRDLGGVALDWVSYTPYRTRHFC
jgi:hypothetical protein